MRVDGRAQQPCYVKLFYISLRSCRLKAKKYLTSGLKVSKVHFFLIFELRVYISMVFHMLRPFLICLLCLGPIAWSLEKLGKTKQFYNLCIFSHP